MNEYSDLEKKLGYIDVTPNKKYLYRICQMYANNEATIDELVSVFHERAAINSYLTTDDVEGKDIITLSLENDKGSFRKRWYSTNEQLSSWKNTIIYEDELTTVNKPTSFEESKNMGNPIWCFCYNENYWIQHTDIEKETIYFIHTLSQNELNYCAACVLPNGDIRILDERHHRLSRKNGELYTYLNGIKAAKSVLTSDKKITNSKQDTNMKTENRNRNVVRLTESKLKQIVAESVKKALNESELDPYFSHKNNEWENDYFNDALLLIRGIENNLAAMEEGGNPMDMQSTEYLYREAEQRLKKLNDIFPLIRKMYFKQVSNSL